MCIRDRHRGRHHLHRVAEARLPLREAGSHPPAVRHAPCGPGPGQQRAAAEGSGGGPGGGPPEG
eukprot:1428487-Pyramimonas_sp.AAC.1